MARCAVVIVNYNTRPELAACLATVQPEAPAELVVVDNASSDGSAALVRAHYPQAVLCANAVNVGYGAAANQGIAACAAPYVLLLNSDTRLQTGALAALSAYLDAHPSAAIVGPRLVHPDNRPQVSCYPFPTPLTTFLLESQGGELLRYLPWLRDHYRPAWPPREARGVPWVLGAALALRRQAWEAVGGFDPAFFMYFEEVDLCYRLKAAAWETHFAPVTTVVHVGGASTRQRQTEMAVQLLASTLAFGRRHSSRLTQAQFLVVVKIIALARWLVNTVRLRTASAEAEVTQTRANLAAWRRVVLGHW